jgi:DNA-binding transcriptional MerR regulator
VDDVADQAGRAARREAGREAAPEWTVGPAARLVGTTVRTLHHYDAVGLVTPSGRTPAGYRTYTEADLDRLRHALVWRELGFSLERIPELLEADPADRAARLLEQVAAVSERIDRLQRVRAALEEEVRAVTGGLPLTQEDKRELFGDEWLGNEAEYAAEAEERWGDTDAWRQSRERTSRYTKADWERIKAEGEAIEQRFVELMRTGEPADGEAATAVAEEARQLNSRWFYEMSGEMQAGLGRMFVEDPRFAAYYEQQAEGLAAFVSAAYVANGERVGG